MFPTAHSPSSSTVGVAEVRRRLALLWSFAQDFATKTKCQAWSGVAVGLQLVDKQLGTALQTSSYSTEPSTGLPVESRALSIDAVLPAFDDLWRCVRTLRESSPFPTPSAMQDLAERTFSLFVGVIEQQGLTLSHPVGQPYDPRVHEAVATQESSAYPPGTVAAVHQIGLLRPARVSVTRPASSAS